MKLKKNCALLLLLGMFYSSLIAQDTRDSEPVPPPRLILSSNILSFLGGNPSVNVSLERPLNFKRGIELDIDYYFNYMKEQKTDPINYLNTSTNNGLSVLASYKFLLGDDRGLQFFYGPTVGYRSINYDHELAVCTEVAEEVPISGVCECLNLKQNFFTSQSRSVIAAGNVGFQSNYHTKQGGHFFIKIHGRVGLASFFPTVNGRLESVTCPFLANDVAAEEDNLVRFGEGMYSNHTVQLSENVTPYFSFNLKLGYAF